MTIYSTHGIYILSFGWVVVLLLNVYCIPSLLVGKKGRGGGPADLTRQTELSWTIRRVKK
jgi:hypothetical protein